MSEQILCPRLNAPCLRGACEWWVDGGDDEACSEYYQGELAALVLRGLRSLPALLNLIEKAGKYLG